MIKITTILTFLLPIISFTQETSPTYKLNGIGMFFMIFSWSAIIIWNAVCFTKILSKKEED